MSLVLLVALGLAAPVTEVVVVHGETRAPMADVRVKIGGQGGVFGRTDATGRFVVAGFDGMVSRIEVLKPGFRTVAPNGMQSKQRRADGRTEVLVEMIPVGVLAGRVTDPAGAPLADCDVSFLMVTGDGKPPQYSVGRATTNDLGEFRTGRLEPGKYVAMAGPCTRSSGAWDRSMRATYYPNAMEPGQAKVLQVVSGKTVRAEWQIVRKSLARVSGRVIPRAGDRLFSMIQLLPSGPLKLGSMSGNSFTQQEAFELTDVEPGRYLLAVQNVSSGLAQEPTSGALEVEVGERDLEGLKVELQAPRDLRGQVVFTKGCKPVPLRVRGARTAAHGQAGSGGGDGSGRAVRGAWSRLGGGRCGGARGGWLGAVLARVDDPGRAGEDRGGAWPDPEAGRRAAGGGDLSGM